MAIERPEKIGEAMRIRNRSRARLMLSVAVIALFVSVLIGRLVYLQVFDYSNLATRSSENRVEIVPIPPVRGQIYDRQGVLLAGNRTVYSLAIIPANASNLDQLLDDIQTIVPVSERDLADFRKSLRINSRYDLHILKDYLDEHEVGRLAVERYRLPGAYISAVLHRDYRAGEAASHVVGRLSRIDENDLASINRARYRGIQHIGKHGTELYGEDILVGWSGHERVETNAHGQKVRTLSQVLPTSGRNIYLTIDQDLQRFAYDIIGDEKGALVALEPATGRVLAMVSKPSYDPNDFAVFSEPGKALELLDAKDSPLINRTIQGMYAPGSTIKPFMSLAGFDHALENFKVTCPGYYQLPGVEHKYRCWKEEGHGVTDYKKAMAESCDVFFYALAYKLGIDRIQSVLSQFGFGDRTEVGLRNEKPGILPSRQWKREVLNEPWYHGETLITGIGQSYISVTMMQLAHATSIIANRGQRYRPQLIYKVVDTNIGEETVFAPVLVGNVDLRKRHFEKVIDDMVEVVHGERGTARAIGRDAKYTIAGKTGTVQVIGRAQDEDWDETKIAKKHLPHGVFMSFAPVDDPQVVVAVIVENSISGSNVAPIARKVMDYYLEKQAKTKSGSDVVFNNTIQ